MAVKLFPSDCVLTDNSFLELGFDMGGSDRKNEYVPHFDVQRAVVYLRSNPELAARFLTLAKGEGDIFWAGDMSSDRVGEGSIGVNVLRRRDGEEASGDNLFGKFLTKVRASLRHSLSDVMLDEVPEREGQVICDFTRRGSFLSDIEEREKAGQRFIHVDVYRPARFRYDTALDGTTGHAGRMVDEEVPFHRFVCPFGTSYPSPVIVGSAAEASILYEQAIRGELDWKALFGQLRERNLLDSKLTEKQVDALISEYKAQFDWMREQIVFNRDLRDLPIVASSKMVPDSSMGRSVYDSEEAPSPADVLARYINNPLLLYVGGENGVMRSLGLLDKHEPERFMRPDGTDDIVIMVVGSDTIGGRQPGRKATQEIVRRETRDMDGRTIVKAEKVYQVPIKSEKEREADYHAFAERLDTILADMVGDRKVTLVTGNVSSSGTSVGVGTPRMVERYVREHGGNVDKYDLSAGRVVPGAGHDDGRKLGAILMEHFVDCAPVLMGASESVSFRLNENDEDSEVLFRDGRLRGNGAVCFSDTQDTGVRNVLSVASFAADMGLPVIHVQELYSEEKQRNALEAGAAMSRSGLFVEAPTVDKIFSGNRKSWDFSEMNHLSLIDEGSGLHIPMVADKCNASVLVGGFSFSSPLGVYVALCASEMLSGTERLKETLAAIQKGEGSSAELISVYEDFLGKKDVSDVLGDFLQERLLREAVRRVADADSSFMEKLLSLDGRGIIMSSTQGAYDLFVGPDGEGLNRFGLAMQAEADAIRALREARVQAEKEEREKMIAEAAKRQRIAVGMKAEGQKVVGGLPQNAAEAKGAVWFIGTNEPLGLALPDGDESFTLWDDMDGDDPLVREKVARPTVSDGVGGEVPNNFVFLFPTDLGSVTGRTRVTNKADNRNLTGVVRTDPKTGEKFVAAYGIPVRFNNKGNELVNDDNLPCSYRLDNNASDFLSSVILADSRARTTALEHDCALILPGRERSDGSIHYSLGQVFMPQVYNRKERKWMPNPHQSPLCLSIVENYISLLETGKRYPLNCIPMPRSLYHTQDDPVVKSLVNEGKRFISAEGRFISDLMMSLQVANATALAMGVPLRFPLDKDGHIDLGPGVPEKYRLMAEKRIDSFIGVKKSFELTEGALPLLERVPMYVSGDYRDMLVKSGTDLYMRPNELAVAFGQYDFSGMFGGTPVPLHEMAFRMEDGTFFTVKDAKSTRSVKDRDEINGYLDYTKNDIRRFIIRTTNVEKVPEFISLLKAYSERAAAVKVSVRLVTEAEMTGVSGSDGNVEQNKGLEGFVNLLSSNSDEFAEDEHDIGREATVYNAVGRVRQEALKDGNGKVIQYVDVVEKERNVLGEKTSGVYYGKVDAGDGFRGYAQIKYILPDGNESGWHTISDLSLAKDTVMSLVSRSYRSDDYVVPPMSSMELLWKAEAVSAAGDAFRNMVWSPNKPREVDDNKVVEIKRVSADEGQDLRKGSQSVGSEGKVMDIWHGSSKYGPSNAWLSNLFPRPFEIDGVHFASVEHYFQYMKADFCGDRDACGRILAAQSGAEAKGIGRTAGSGSFDAVGWDRVSASMMETGIRESFMQNPAELERLLALGDVTFTHVHDSGRWGELFPEILMRVRNGFLQERLGEKEGQSHDEVPSGVQETVAEKLGSGDGIVFTESSGGYQKRTYENANADDVDFTIAIAVDFSTYGEQATAKAAGDSFISAQIDDLSAKSVKKAVDVISRQLPEEFLNGEPMGVNFAGNGIYTLSKRGITQDSLDEFMVKVVSGLQSKGVVIQSVRSGGQTGVDEASLSAAMALGIPCVCHAPKGWQIRDANGKDHSDEALFKKRFDEKNLKKLASLSKASIKKGQRKTT